MGTQNGAMARVDQKGHGSGYQLTWSSRKGKSWQRWVTFPAGTELAVGSAVTVDISWDDDWKFTGRVSGGATQQAQPAQQSAPPVQEQARSRYPISQEVNALVALTKKLRAALPDAEAATINTLIIRIAQGDGVERLCAYLAARDVGAAPARQHSRPPVEEVPPPEDIPDPAEFGIDDDVPF